MAPRRPKDNQPNPQEAAVAKQAASNPQSKTIDDTPPAEDDTTVDRSAEAGHVRPSVPDEFAGLAEPSTDTNKTTKT